MVIVVKGFPGALVPLIKAVVVDNAVTPVPVVMVIVVVTVVPTRVIVPLTG